MPAASLWRGTFLPTVIRYSNYFFNFMYIIFVKLIMLYRNTFILILIHTSPIPADTNFVS